MTFSFQKVLFQCACDLMKMIMFSTITGMKCEINGLWIRFAKYLKSISYLNTAWLFFSNSRRSWTRLHFFKKIININFKDFHNYFVRCIHVADSISVAKPWLLQSFDQCSAELSLQISNYAIRTLPLLPSSLT